MFIFIKIAPMRSSVTMRDWYPFLKIAILSLGAPGRGPKVKVSLEPGIFFLHGLLGHPYVPSYQVSSKLDEVYGRGAKMNSIFLMILAFFDDFLKIRCL